MNASLILVVYNSYYLSLYLVIAKFLFMIKISGHAVPINVINFFSYVIVLQLQYYMYAVEFKLVVFLSLMTFILKKLCTNCTNDCISSYLVISRSHLPPTGGSSVVSSVSYVRTVPAVYLPTTENPDAYQTVVIERKAIFEPPPSVPKDAKTLDLEVGI